MANVIIRALVDRLHLGDGSRLAVGETAEVSEDAAGKMVAAGVAEIASEAPAQAQGRGRKRKRGGEQDASAVH